MARPISSLTQNHPFLHSTAGNCNVQSALSFRFLSVSGSVEMDGELINSHWALNGQGSGYSPAAQANITLCLLAPPTLPPQICLKLEIFSTFCMALLLKRSLLFCEVKTTNLL